MKCIICEGAMSHHFTKTFGQYGLENVDYFACQDCGFTASKTHFEMTDTEWGRLNIDFHNDNNAREDNPYNRNQRYFQQAMMFYLMERHGLLRRDPWLDWGSGLGSVSEQLEHLFSLKLNNFDAYIQPERNVLTQDQLVERGYALVVNTAVFEHVRSRETLNEIESYVAGDGCLAVHTLVRGEIPTDPEWMYLLPVHCAFHTNSSMQVLMEQWGYTCSIYNEQSKTWVMFKQPFRQVRPLVQQLNNKLGFEYLHYKNGFMNYWP